MPEPDRTLRQFAALFTAGAAGVHLFAAGAHDLRSLVGGGMLLTGLLQAFLAGAALLRPARWAGSAILVTDGAAVVAAVLAHTTGLPVPGLREPAPFDGRVVAVLCFQAAAVGILLRGTRPAVRRFVVPAVALGVLATAVPAATATHDPAGRDRGGPAPARAHPPEPRNGMRQAALTAGMSPAQVEEAASAQSRWLAAHLVATGVDRTKAADFSTRAVRSVLASDESNGGHGYAGPVPNDPITDPAVRTALAGQVTAARAAALALPSAADAQRAGYVLAAPGLPGVGAHWLNARNLADGVFDPAKPELLLYAGNGPTAQVVGVGYLAPDGAAAEGFAGPNDRWHRHDDLCRVGGLAVPYPDRRSCTEVGGTLGGGYAEQPVRMLHAWVVPGWESPWGLFSGENPELTLGVTREA